MLDELTMYNKLMKYEYVTVWLSQEKKNRFLENLNSVCSYIDGKKFELLNKINLRLIE